MSELDVRRRSSVVGPDGVDYEILAAKRGALLREQSLDGTGAANTIASFVVGVIVGVVVTAVLDVGAASRSTWKLGVVRREGFPQRVRHREVLSPSVDPEARMQELAALIRSGSLR